MGFSENSRGLVLAMVSSLFIGTSFILKKKGLKRAAAAGTRAGVGGYTYLLEPLWWSGMITMIVWEVSNFVAYIYAPAVLVTPLGALSIIISAILAHFLLRERLQLLGVVGCILCIVGSVVIVVHAPQEHMPTSVQEIWILAIQPAFLIYVAATVSVVVALMLHFEPRCGQTNVLVYLGICSLMGALTVVSIKAIGIAIKLTLEGISQIAYPQTWFFLAVAVICVITQLNYLNKDWAGQDASSIVSEICGFITVLSGTVVLHVTREQEPATTPGNISWYDGEDIKVMEDGHYIMLNDSNYFR
uniref:Probable magnesium transporter n=1 Tax=Nicotiana sylvestris TaxID=4096 RepID=A0A1U7WWJ2_NICSY|nr:PREDICTED: probable magnesium transporter NIPA6 isoform X2 [Nicotiana sylvestris]